MCITHVLKHVECLLSFPSDHCHHHYWRWRSCNWVNAIGIFFFTCPEWTVQLLLHVSSTSWDERRFSSCKMSRHPDSRWRWFNSYSWPFSFFTAFQQIVPLFQLFSEDDFCYTAFTRPVNSKRLFYLFCLTVGLKSLICEQWLINIQCTSKCHKMFYYRINYYWISLQFNIYVCMLLTTEYVAVQQTFISCLRLHYYGLN